MSPIQASCPSCGAPVKFKVGTALVAVCEYCRCVIGRGDRTLEDLGKIADVTDSGSPLDLWLKGRYEGVPFDLTGRVQYAHPAGGFWDEWYAHFADGRWGWVAEAQGRFYITFQQPSRPGLPAYDVLQLGQAIAVGPHDAQMIVAEKNRGKAIAAKGEIPFRLAPNADHPFADLSGPDAAFGTLDYSEAPPLIFLGREVTLETLGIAKGVKPGRREAREVAGVALNCPNCGAALALKAPDKAERVGCPSCGSLLDMNEGQLRLLQSLEPPKVEPLIPLGATGEIDGAKMTALGFMQRSVRIDATRYFWMEYLLYEPRVGFRWLVHSDDHWTFVRPLPPGEIASSSEHDRRVKYQGKEYVLFQRSTARVEFVIGEFYWKVSAGETVTARDFVKVPEMLSQEITRTGDEGEINWSHGVYMEKAEVERIFGVQDLPEPQGVGPCQPFPYSPVYRQFAWLLGAAVVLLLLAFIAIPRHRALAQTFPLLPPAIETGDRYLIVEKPFLLRGHENVKIALRAVRGGWVHVDGKLTSTNSPLRRSFSVTANPGKDSWVYLSSVPRGKYGLDLKFKWLTPKTEGEAELVVEQGVVHPMPFFLLLLALAAVPCGVGLYHARFEAQRWAGSSLEESEEATASPERPSESAGAGDAKEDS